MMSIPNIGGHAAFLPGIGQASAIASAGVVLDQVAP